MLSKRIRARLVTFLENIFIKMITRKWICIVKIQNVAVSIIRGDVLFQCLPYKLCFSYKKGFTTWIEDNVFPNLHPNDFKSSGMIPAS